MTALHTIRDVQFHQEQTVLGVLYIRKLVQSAILVVTKAKKRVCSVINKGGILHAKARFRFTGGSSKKGQQA